MANPLTWDSPTPLWDSAGATWDGVQASPRKMSKTKAIVDFSGYAGPALAPAAQTIHDQMTANAAIFTAPPVTMAALQTVIDTFLQKLAAKASRASQDTIAYNLARHDLEVALGELGGYVNSVAKGDEATVAKSGFPYYASGHVTPGALPAAPANVRLIHGDLPGSVVARYHPGPAHSMNEVQTNPGDPNNEAGWVHAGMFSGGKALLSGLPLAITLWVRIRTAGLKGAMGPWSDPAKIIVT